MIRNQRGDFAYYLEYEPIALAGYSIYVFDITLNEANRVRQKLGWPLLDEPPGIGHETDHSNSVLQ